MKELALIFSGGLVAVFACTRIATSSLMIGAEWLQARSAGGPKWPVVMAGVFSSGPWVLIGAVAFIWWLVATPTLPAWTPLFTKGLIGGVIFYVAVVLWGMWRFKQRSKPNVQA